MDYEEIGCVLNSSVWTGEDDIKMDHVEIGSVLILSALLEAASA
jgi:hypothetical protein